jgi:hypothetical protein
MQLFPLGVAPLRLDETPALSVGPFACDREKKKKFSTAWIEQATSRYNFTLQPG